MRDASDRVHDNFGVLAFLLMMFFFLSLHGHFDREDDGSLPSNINEGGDVWDI
jgi:hypothetical protein